MRYLIAKRVPVAWLLIVFITSVGALVVLKVGVLDAPPHNAVLIERAPDNEPNPPQAVTSANGAGGTPAADLSSATQPTEVIAQVSPTPFMLAVYISGAVRNPGVVLLPEGSRVADAVAAAGGTLPEADLERVNLAARLADEEHIIVPRKGETPVAQSSDPPAQPSPKPARTPIATPDSAGGRININMATAAELEELPGIGEVLAARIVEYRRVNGPFRSVDDLMNVSGIKDAVMSQIRDLVTVGP